eukprot:751859-Hanusia_phi.AAC.2
MKETLRDAALSDLISVCGKTIPSICGTSGIHVLQSPIQQEEVLFLEAPRVFGLCIGANDYVQKGWDLRNAVRDAETLHQRLRSTSRSWSILKKNPQSSSHLKRFLRKGLSSLGQSPPELVIVFFAGHGMKVGRAMEDVLLPCDVETLVSEDEIRDYAVSVNEIFDLMKTFENDLKQRGLGNKSVSFLVIVDACRSGDKLREAKSLLPQEPVKNVLPRFWCLCFTCSNGEKADDESEFFQQFVAEEEGIFACNRSLQETVMDCANRSKTEEQSAVCINPQVLPKFCLVEDGELSREIMKIQEGISRGSINVTSSTEHDRTSCKEQDTLVFAYSSEPIEHFRGHVRTLLRDFLSNLKEVQPRWRLCSLFLLAFLRDQETRFSSIFMMSHYKRISVEIGPELIKRVNTMLQRGKISSAKFDAWKSKKRLSDISQEKLCISVLHFTVAEEIRRNIKEENEAEDAIELWETEGLDDGNSYKASVSMEEALDTMERHLSNETCFYEENKYSETLFAGYLLNKAIETGSFVLVMRMTEFQSICFFRFLLELGRMGRAGGQEGHRERNAYFNTFISSSGWLIRHTEFKTDWRRMDECWVEGLKKNFQRVVEGDRSEYMRWIDFLEEGDWM